MDFKQYLLEFVSSEDLETFEERVKSELGLSKFSLNLFPKANAISLQLIVVSKEGQGKGAGTKAMKMLCDYADKNKLKIILSPSEKDSRLGTTSKSRLIEFYKRFGFVMNKGKSKDFTFQDSMYREPR